MTRDSQTAAGEHEASRDATRKPGLPSLRRIGERLGLLAQPPEGNLYHGFISYSHAADHTLAPALQRGLQRFAKPWYRARAQSIFRDDTSLSATPHLWTSIQAALDASEFFILLASPEAAESTWVAREAERWCATKPTKRLLVGLTDGELAWDENAGDFDWSRTDALPPSSCGSFMEASAGRIRPGETRGRRINPSIHRRSPDRTRSRPPSRAPRNEGVPGSSPGVGSGDLGALARRGQRGGQQQPPRGSDPPRPFRQDWDAPREPPSSDAHAQQVRSAAWQRDLSCVMGCGEYPRLMGQRTAGDLMFEAYLAACGLDVPEHEPDLGLNSQTGLPPQRQRSDLPLRGQGVRGDD
jgi:TIR domain